MIRDKPTGAEDAPEPRVGLRSAGRIACFQVRNLHGTRQAAASPGFRPTAQLDVGPKFDLQARPVLRCADDPIEGVNDGVPIRPDIGRSIPRELWEEQIKRERKQKRKPEEDPGVPPRRPPDGHIIDDYAAPA